MYGLVELGANESPCLADAICVIWACMEASAAWVPASSGMVISPPELRRQELPSLQCVPHPAALCSPCPFRRANRCPRKTSIPPHVRAAPTADVWTLVCWDGRIAVLGLQPQPPP